MDMRIFQDQCERAGGEYVFDPLDQGADIEVCDFGDHDIVVHGYLDQYEHGSVEVHGDTDWTGRVTGLEYENGIFVLEEAEGNPGPPGPMYVDDARVEINNISVRGSRTQEF